MNILLWVLQVLVATWTILGAQYMARHYGELIYPWALNMFPWQTWALMASLEVIFALGLVLPGVLKVFPKATPVSAIGSALLFLLGPVFFIGYAGAAGMLWGVIPAIISLFIAYKRWPKATTI